MTPPHHPAILRLDIHRFRGIESLTWRPAAGVNVIIGGGDAGKSTILAAVELLLLPSNAVALSDADYHDSKLDEGFEIEAAMFLPPDTQVNRQFKMAWPWAWDGEKAVLPSDAGDPSSTGNGCYVLRASGSPELDLVHEILQPDGTTASLSVSLRRNIGLVLLDSQERDDRDLRLLRGSALDRLIGDPALRSRLASKLARANVSAELRKEGKEALEALDAAFMKEGLPSKLDLGLTGARGLAVTALMGLTAERASTRLPLASWGAGTRRLASLAVARAHQSERPVITVDEVERGLEPYRQRSLIQALQQAQSQSFITTHSPTVLSAADSAQIWHLDRAGQVGELAGKVVQRHLARDPETFLSRLAIVAEGATEVGFVTALLEKALNGSLVAHGIHVTDGGGNDDVRSLLESLSKAGFSFGGFADDEGRHSESWSKLTAGNPLVFQWRTGCLEQNIVSATPKDRWEQLIEDPGDLLTGVRLRTLADRLGAEERTFQQIAAMAADRLPQVIIDAATGTLPEGAAPASRNKWKGEAQSWFKTQRGGRELADKTFLLGAWTLVRDELLPFVNAVLAVVGRDRVDDLA